MLDDDFSPADLDQDNAEDTEECVHPSLEVFLLTAMSPGVRYGFSV